MNAQQRKTLNGFTDELNQHLSVIREMSAATYIDTRKEFAGKIEDIRSQVEEMAGEEQDKFDNMSEGLQQGENGQRIEQAAEALDTGFNNLQYCIDVLEAEEFTDDDVNEAVESLESGIDNIQDAVNA